MLNIYQVDAFADKPFSGNPAAVCMLQESLDDELMQHIAAEMNLSETAFLMKEDDGYRLRWFTPAYEVDLCGHATLASAHTLWETGLLGEDETARFHSRSGLLQARKVEAGIELDFPSQPPWRVEVPLKLLQSLDVEPVFGGYNGSDYIIVVDNQRIVEQLNPDFRMMGEVKMRGVIVTAPGREAGMDFISRFFAPSAGIDEDPVTGSAHCCLAPYWAEKLEKTSMQARQISPRGGNVHVRLENDRVFLTGKATMIMEGKLLVS